MLLGIAGDSGDLTLYYGSPQGNLFSTKKKKQQNYDTNNKKNNKKYNDKPNKILTIIKQNIRSAEISEVQFLHPSQVYRTPSCLEQKPLIDVVVGVELSTSKTG